MPALLESVAAHYGLPSVNLIEPLACLPRNALDTVFRDDCHHTPVGAAYVASLLAEALELCLPAHADGTPPQPAPPASLPPVMDPAHWMGGHGVHPVHVVVPFVELVVVVQWGRRTAGRLENGGSSGAGSLPMSNGGRLPAKVVKDTPLRKIGRASERSV